MNVIPIGVEGLKKKSKNFFFLRKHIGENWVNKILEKIDLSFKSETRTTQNKGLILGYLTYEFQEILIKCVRIEGFKDWIKEIKGSALSKKSQQFDDIAIEVWILGELIKKSKKVIFNYENTEAFIFKNDLKFCVDVKRFNSLNGSPLNKAQDLLKKSKKKFRKLPNGLKGILFVEYSPLFTRVTDFQENISYLEPNSEIEQFRDELERKLKLNSNKELIAVVLFQMFCHIPNRNKDFVSIKRSSHFEIFINPNNASFATREQIVLLLAPEIKLAK